ncbi:MAG: flagellar biogenesis protein FliO [Sphingobium sp.]|nr:flagellar biogenesis protein FliO [Sphingobium sp.]
MFWYFVKLIVLLPLLGGMIYASLWLWRKYQPAMMGAQGDRSIKIIEMLPVGTFGKLAVVEFDGKRLLVSMTRGRIEKLAEGHAVDAATGEVLINDPTGNIGAADGFRSGKYESPYRAR